VKSGPISSRTRSKKAAQASSVPGCAIIPISLLRGRTAQLTQICRILFNYTWNACDKHVACSRLH